jgi:ceramide glucosyltransferase
LPSALSIAMRVAARYPHVPAKFLSSGEPPYANARVWSLERMQRAAAHKIFVVSDSDVSVTPNYLRAVVAPLADELMRNRSQVADSPPAATRLVRFE